MTSPRAPITVRLKDASDDEFVAALASEAFSEYSDGAARYTIATTYAAGSRAFVAVRGTRRVGLVVLQPMSGVHACIVAIAVEPSERGRGVGYRLMSAAERFALRAGFRRLTLFTAQDNVAALDLFFRRGFTITRRIARFYGPGQDACELEKRLGASA